MIRYFNLENCEIGYVPTEQELEEKGFPILKWKCNINVGDKMGKVVDGHSIMGRGYFVIEGTSEDDLKQQAESILALFKTKELK